MKEDIISLLYIDDTLFFAKDDAIIDSHISKLKKLGFDLTDDGDVESFLGVKINKWIHISQFMNSQSKVQMHHSEL